MAKVVVSSGYSLYGPNGGRMASPDFTGWHYASLLPDGSVELRPNSREVFVDLTNVTLKGTGLSITPNPASGPGLAVADRHVTGTITGFSYLSGTTVSHGSVGVQYNITGLNVSFSALVAAGSDPLALLLAGHDEVIGSNSYDALYGYGGNDQIFGGSGDDYLDGGAGNDLLYGGLGADHLVGGADYDFLRGDEGGDRLDGGAGTDRADYYNSNAAVTINLAAGTGVGGHAHGDILIGIENVYGSAFSDVLIGSNFANTLFGYAGNDQLYGLAGNDVLYGQDGNDILRGDEGADVINGGAGIDRADYYNSNAGVFINLTSGIGYYGHAHGDTFSGIENLYGSAFDDVLAGSAEANTLYGNAGNDKLFGLAGNDYLEGQAGHDALYGGNGYDVLGGGDGDDGLFGEAGNDTMYGGTGNDYLAGGDGNDVIWGDAGHDQIDAGAGNDYVVLGVGDDAFTLGAGDDRVRFDYGNGRDTIFDFGNGHDVIDFSATDMTLAVLQANAIDTAGGVLLQVGSGSILLAGLSLHQIEWSYDFAFAPTH